MAKFYGVIGFGESVEEPPGVYSDVINEFPYYGDVVKSMRNLRDGDQLNADLSLSNSISVVSDQYINEHFFAIKFVEFAGGLWTVTSVEVKPPRLLLILGGVYNGPRAE